MASINELKDVLKDTLEEKGILSEVRAKIRAEIFNALNDKPISKPALPNENLIINEMIREYLMFNNYHHSLSVFLPESGQPKEPPFDRKYISKKLKIVEDSNSRELPLMYSLIFGMKEMLGKGGSTNQDAATERRQTGKKQGGYKSVFDVGDPEPMSYQ